MNLLLYKLILLLVMLLATLIAGLLPVKVLRYLRRSAAHAASAQHHKHVSLVLCLLTCFSGGVFLATCFLHLFPELVESWDELNEKYALDVHYPIAELLSCIGFFLLFFAEEVIIMLLPSLAHLHGHGGGHAHGHSHGNGHHNHTSSISSIKAAQEGDGAPLVDPSGCCMASFPAKEIVKETKEPEKVHPTSEDPMLETGSTVSEAAGHCQTHCPLTVHRRRQSDNECKAVPSDRPRSYGSTEDCRTEKRPERPSFVRCKSDRGVFTAVILAEPERCETNCDEVDEDPPILMKSSPHAHSHGVRSLTMVLALSFHSVIEGLALGVAGSATEATTLFLSLLVHKLIVAFSVGTQLTRTHAHSLQWVVLSMFALSVMSPFGAVIGMGVQFSMDGFLKDSLVTVFQGLAVGTFIYVTFFEVLLHERDNEHPNLLKLLFMLIGFSLIGLLRLFDEHTHGDGQGHGHSHVHGEELLLTSTTVTAIGF